ncbi:MAG: sulfotransferase [Bacteroidota bacterium]|nr:sulfotransferase [Bacteroidota bacterium]
MPDNKLPPISPLAGSSVPVLFRVLRGNRVAPRYYFKVWVTKFFVLISSAFHWIDRLVFNKKLKKYTFKQSPIFIIGFWRSGTTFLHNLLTNVPDTGFVSTYHAVFPNNLKSAWLFKTFMRLLMPKKRWGDDVKMSVNHPQEDEYALSNITHRSFYHFFYFPSSHRSLYTRYIRFESLSADEEDEWKLDYRKMVIKALLSTSGTQAILKNPVNTGRMLKLLEIFPGAHFIFLIRNPVLVYLSAKKFFSALFPSVNLEKFSREQISQMILDVYVRLLHDYLADKKHLPPGSIIEIRYEELQESPIEELEKIYNEFGFSNFQEVLPVYREFLETQKEHRVDVYTMDKKELDHVLSKLDFAMKHWGYELPDELEVLDHKPEQKETPIGKAM